MPNQSSKTKTVCARINNSTYDYIEKYIVKYHIAKNDFIKAVLEQVESGKIPVDLSNISRG